MKFQKAATLAATTAPFVVSAQSTTPAACPTVLKPSYAAPSLAAGWSAQLVATGLTKPRSIMFDSNGHLLVVQQGAGIINLELTAGDGTCINVAKKTNLINSEEVSPP